MRRICLLLLSISSSMFPAASPLLKMPLRAGVRSLQGAAGSPLQMTGSSRFRMSHGLTSDKDLLNDSASMSSDNIQKILENGDREQLSSLIRIQADEIQRLRHTQPMNFSIGNFYGLALSCIQLHEKYTAMMKTMLQEWRVNRSKQIYAHRRHWISEKARVLGRVSDGDIIFAVEHGDNELIEHLLKYGANPNACASDGFLSEKALRRCDAAGLKMLLDAGTKAYNVNSEIPSLVLNSNRHGDRNDAIRKIMLLISSVCDYELEYLIFLARDRPTLKVYFESIQVMRSNSTSVSEKELAQEKILLFMQEHGINEEEVTIVPRTKAASSRVQEAD